MDLVDICLASDHVDIFVDPGPEKTSHVNEQSSQEQTKRIPNE